MRGRRALKLGGLICVALVTLGALTALAVRAPSLGVLRGNGGAWIALIGVAGAVVLTAAAVRADRALRR